MWETQHMRKLAAGCALIVGPALALLSWILWPSLPRNGTEFLADVTRYTRTSITWSIVLSAASIAVMVVATIGLVHLLHDRTSATGVIGGGFAIMGLTLIAASTGVAFAGFEVGTSGLSTIDKIALGDAFMKSTVFTVMAVGAFMMAFGYVLLGGAMYTARVAPMPSAILLAAFGVVQLVGFATFSSPVVLASFVMLVLAAVPIGWAVLTESDEAWEHPREFHGYRIAGAHP